MELIIGIAIIFGIYKIFSGNNRTSKNSGVCKYCGGELYATHKPGYSLKCKDCRAEFP